MLLSCVILGMMYILAALIDWDRDSLDRLISMNISCLLKVNSNYATTLIHFRCLPLVTIPLLMRLLSRRSHATVVHSIGICKTIYHCWRFGDQAKLVKKLGRRILFRKIRRRQFSKESAVLQIRNQSHVRITVFKHSWHFVIENDIFQTPDASIFTARQNVTQWRNISLLWTSFKWSNAKASNFGSGKKDFNLETCFGVSPDHAQPLGTHRIKSPLCHNECGSNCRGL